MKFFLSAALAAALVAPASAQDAVLVKTSGPVSFLQGGARRFVKARGGEELLFGDAIRVGEGGIAHVAFPGRGALLLRGRTLMSLQGSTSRTSLRIDFGEFLVGLAAKRGRGGSFKVRTPAAVADARGALFWGKADEADKTTTYAGFGRKIAVTALGRSVIVEPGTKVAVSRGSAPADAEPSAIGLGFLEGFRIGGSLQGLESLAEPGKLPK